ncbi:hypothetical protein ACWG0P_01695 [Amedibacillus sp. YH-ame6]
MPVKYDYDWEKLHKEQQLSGLNMKRFVESVVFLIRVSRTINTNL